MIDTLTALYFPNKIGEISKLSSISSFPFSTPKMDATEEIMSVKLFCFEVSCS
jgi:hypothetical protein